MSDAGVDHLAGRPIAISGEELDRRRARVWSGVVARGCDLFVGLDAATIRYLTGYALVPNERPFAVVLDMSGELTLFVPLLKEYDASQRARADRIVSYRDYPGETHPMVGLAALLGDFRAGRMLLELDDHASPHGYQGRSLSAMIEAPVQLDRTLVQAVRMVKSDEEIALLRHASDWALVAHKRLQDAVEAGRTESEISGDASGSALRAMRRLYGHADRRMTVSAGFGGQIGADGTAHHFQTEVDPAVDDGDLLITKVFAQVGGYYSDVERTLVCSAAASETRDLFQRGEDIHAFALELVGPGVGAGEIDRQVFRRYGMLGIEDCWRHHVGHSVGLLEREAPYLDIGTDTVLEPGMVVTIEPGVYRAGVGGFRHSDCLLVTSDGHEILTEYPRDLDSLTCGR